MIDQKFRDNIVKVAVDPRGDRRLLWTWKTAINLFFNHNKSSNYAPLAALHHLSAYWHWKLADKRERLSAVTVKFLIDGDEKCNH